MARYETRVLPFPVLVNRQLAALPDDLLRRVKGPEPPAPPDPQLSALPNEPTFDALRRINRLLANPEIAALRLQHEMLRLQRLGPFLDAHQTLRVQGEVGLLAIALDDLEAQVKITAVRQAKAVGLIA